MKSFNFVEIKQVLTSRRQNLNICICKLQFQLNGTVFKPIEFLHK